MKNTLQNWFTQLDRREQIMVAGAAVVVVFALVFVLGIQPLYQNTARVSERVAEKEALLARLEQAASRLGPTISASGQPAQGRGQSIVIIVDRTTRTRGLATYLKRNQPDGNDGIRLRFEGAPFDELVAWITELQHQYGLSTISANFDVATGPGRVNCSLVLQRTGT